eukprot:2942381-Amphidinium_carterae.1
MPCFTVFLDAPPLKCRVLWSLLVRGKGLLDDARPGTGRGPSRASSISSSVTRAPGEPEDCQMEQEECKHT